MLLALDTSTPQIGLALYDGARVLAESLWLSQARHTVELAPAAARLLERSGFTLTDVQALGVALGPGSFTSLRVGLAFAKGLAFSRSLPLIGIPTLDTLAAAAPPSDLPLACFLPAGRGRLALGWYAFAVGPGWQPQGENQVTTAQDFAALTPQPCLVMGEFTLAERQTLEACERFRVASPALSARRPALLAELAFRRWQAGGADSLSSLAPLYLHIGAPIPADSSLP